MHGDTPFQGTGLVRGIYFVILISHILLTVVALPMILTAVFFALTARYESHRRAQPVPMVVGGGGHHTLRPSHGEELRQVVLQPLRVPGPASDAQRQAHGRSSRLAGYGTASHPDGSHLLVLQGVVGLPERRAPHPRRVSRVLVVMTCHSGPWTGGPVDRALATSGSRRRSRTGTGHPRRARCPWKMSCPFFGRDDRDDVA